MQFGPNCRQPPATMGGARVLVLGRLRAGCWAMQLWRNYHSDGLKTFQCSHFGVSLMLQIPWFVIGTLGERADGVPIFPWEDILTTGKKKTVSLLTTPYQGR